MSQLVACTYPGGLLIAADRRVVVTRKGKEEVHAVRKLFSLGPSAAVATSGAAVAILVSRTLSRLLRRRARFPFPDLEAYALSVFQKEYDAFVRQGAEWFAAHPEAHRLSYVLLGGQTGGECVFRFYASEEHHEPYRLLRTATVLTAPRRLGLESRLARAATAGAGREEIRDIAAEGLLRIEEKDDAVGGPFDVAELGAGGVRVATFGKAG